MSFAPSPSPTRTHCQQTRKTPYSACLRLRLYPVVSLRRARAKLRHLDAYNRLFVVDSATKEKIAEDAKIAKSLGEIRVDIHLAKTTNLGDLRISVKQTGEFALAEKAMKGKAISHGTS